MFHNILLQEVPLHHISTHDLEHLALVGISGQFKKKKIQKHSSTF